MVRSILLHGCEAWSFNAGFRPLDVFGRRFVCSIDRIGQSDGANNVEVRIRMYSIGLDNTESTRLKLNELRCLGHILRKANELVSYRALFYVSVSKSRGRAEVNRWRGSMGWENVWRTRVTFVTRPCSCDPKHMSASGLETFAIPLSPSIETEWLKKCAYEVWLHSVCWIIWQAPFPPHLVHSLFTLNIVFVAVCNLVIKTVISEAPTVAWLWRTMIMK